MSTKYVSNKLPIVDLERDIGGLAESQSWKGWCVHKSTDKSLQLTSYYWPISLVRMEEFDY